MTSTTANTHSLPAICLGTWAWGSGINGSQSIFGENNSPAELEKVFRAACDKGFSLWDTAPVYGFGNSEALLGQFAHNQEIQLSTKFTPLGIQGKSALEKSFQKSCKRLSRDHIDIYWIHRPANVKKWTTKLLPLLQRGQVGTVGVSNHNLAQIKAAEAILQKHGYSLGAVQNHYSLLYRKAEQEGILPYCQSKSITFFSYMVLEQGALTGVYTKEHPFPKHSRRGKAFPPECLKMLSSLHTLIHTLAQQYAVTETAILIAWAISKGTLPIVGVTKERHIRALEDAVSLTLSTETIALLEQTAADTKVCIAASWE